MTDKLEKTFFDTFGIEPKIIDTAVGRGFYIEHSRVYKYPEITDRILLELICIVLNAYEKLEVYTECTVEKVKEKTLKQLILAQDDVYSQVRTLFKEG